MAPYTPAKQRLKKLTLFQGQFFLLILFLLFYTLYKTVSYTFNRVAIIDYFFDKQ